MGKKYVPPEGTRHILLPKDIIEGNIDQSKMRDNVKQSLISLSKRLKSITPEQFKMLSQKPELRDTFICSTCFQPLHFPAALSTVVPCTKYIIFNSFINLSFFSFLLLFYNLHLDLCTY